METGNRGGQFTRASRLFRKSGLKPDEANELTELMGHMASTNVLDRIDTSYAQLESKVDSGFHSIHADLKAQDATLETKIDAQNAKYNVLIWVIGVGLTLISIGVTLLVASNFVN